MKCKRCVQVANDMGLHTRPATIIVKMLQCCKSDVYFTHKQETINAKSILGILMLAARKNAKIVITAKGEDAEEVIEKLSHAFDTKFEE